MYTYNNSRSVTIGKTPFEVVYTFQPTVKKNVEGELLTLGNTLVEERLERIRKIHEELKR